MFSPSGAMLSLCVFSLHLTIQKKQRKFNISRSAENGDEINIFLLVD